MPITRKGYFELFRADGTKVSRHSDENVAIARAYTEGPGTYKLKSPDLSIEVEAHECDPDPPPNVPPTIALVSPADGATFEAPATLSITATAADSDGLIENVEFFLGDTSIGTDAEAPYAAQASNLPPGDYVLTVRGRDNDGAETRSAPRTVRVVEASPPPPPGGSVPDLRTLAADPITGTVSPIALGQTYIDPVYGTRIQRASHNDYRHNYSRRQVYNAGETLMLMYRVNAGNWGIYDKQTKAFIRTLNFSAGGDNVEALWHPTDPKIVRYHNGLKWYDHNVESNVSTLLFDFAGKLPWAGATEVWTKGEGCTSADGRTLCLMATHYNAGSQQNQMFGVLTFDTVTKQIVDTLGMTSYPDHISTTPSGRWCVISGNTTYAILARNLDGSSASRFEAKPGPRVLFKREESKFLAEAKRNLSPERFAQMRTVFAPMALIPSAMVLTPFAGDPLSPNAQLHDRSEHSDLCVGEDGHDYYVFCAYSGVDEGWIVSVDIDTGERFRRGRIYGAQNSFTSAHISGQNFERPGYFVVSTYKDASNYGNTVPSATLEPLYRKVSIVTLRPRASGPEAWSVCHPRTTGTDYYDEIQATPNRTLTKIVYASRLGTNTGLSSSYEATVPWVDEQAAQAA